MPLTHQPVFVAAVLCVNVALCEWLVRRTACRHLGTALLVIVVTAVVANAGLIPTADSAVYDGVFTYVANLAIFWLLLGVNLRHVLRAGAQMVGLFLLGAAGTTAGVATGMWVVDGPRSIGDSFRGIGAMFVGTYTGGSVNFNALALHYGIANQGTLYAGSMAVDSFMTTVWMVATIALPRILLPVWPAGRRVTETNSGEVTDHTDHDTETVSPTDLSLLLAAGLLVIGVSDRLADALQQRGVALPPILIVTTAALVLAQIPAVHTLKGTRLLGMFAVYLFLAVIGAFCDVAALRQLGSLGPTLLLFVSVVVGVHGLITFGVAALCRADVDMVAVASQANIGGGTSALALARSLDRGDLVLPAILVGSLGTALGTYLGFVAANYML